MAIPVRIGSSSSKTRLRRKGHHTFVFRFPNTLSLYILLGILATVSMFLVGYILGQLIQELQDETWVQFSEMSLSHIRRHLNCQSPKFGDPEQGKIRQINSLQDWIIMRNSMKGLVENEAPFSDLRPPTLGYTLVNDEPPPFESGLSEGKGRGLFATRDIKEGELVHDGTKSDVIFKDGISFKRYIYNLWLVDKKASNSILACDTTYWAWTQEYNGKFRIFLEANIAIYMNGSKTGANAIPRNKTTQQFYATRDINKGEEIMTDYNIYETKWKEVGMG